MNTPEFPIRRTIYGKGVFPICKHGAMMTAVMFYLNTVHKIFLFFVFKHSKFLTADGAMRAMPVNEYNILSRK